MIGSINYVIYIGDFSMELDNKLNNNCVKLKENSPIQPVFFILTKSF